MISKTNSLVMMPRAKTMLKVLFKLIRKVWKTKMRMMLVRRTLRKPTHQEEEEVERSVALAEEKPNEVAEVLLEVERSQILKWSTEPRRTRQVMKMVRRRSMMTHRMMESRLMTWLTVFQWILTMSRFRQA